MRQGVGVNRSLVAENWGSVFEAPSTIVSSLCVNQAHQAIADYCGNIRYQSLFVFVFLMFCLDEFSGGFSDYSLQYSRVVYNVCSRLGHTVRVAR